MDSRCARTPDSETLRHHARSRAQALPVVAARFRIAFSASAAQRPCLFRQIVIAVSAATKPATTRPRTAAKRSVAAAATEPPASPARYPFPRVDSKHTQTSCKHQEYLWENDLGSTLERVGMLFAVFREPSQCPDAIWRTSTPSWPPTGSCRPRMLR